MSTPIVVNTDLEFVLIVICQIEQSKAYDILKKCESITDLLNNINLKDLKRRAEIDIEE